LVSLFGELPAASAHLYFEGACMAIQKTEKIWHNGKFVAWDDARVHVMSHVVNYGSSVFEGIRCYALPTGPAIFRAPEHMQRLLDSARIYRIDVDFTREQMVRAMVELVKANGVWPCYIRPIILRGYGEVGVNPFNSPTEVYICNYPWGKYLGSDASEGVDVCISSWTRLAPNTLPVMAKSGANYMNSQLIKMEAIVNGYAEGIALDVNGYVSEGSGENLFAVRKGVLQTAPLGNSVLPGITRDSVLEIAKDLGIPVLEQVMPRELLYIADEVFFTGTAAEITPIRSVDKISVGKGTVGPITRSIQQEFYGVVRGEKPDRFQWLTPVPVGSIQPVTV
jgi:branched-chain amino acid aminotransferase